MPFPFRRRLIWIALCAMAALHQGPAGQARAAEGKPSTLYIAAASSLRFTLDEIGARYQKERGVEVVFTYGSSGALAVQIERGAPYDAFFSADERYVDELVEKGHLLAESRFPFALGRLALWAHADADWDAAKGLDVLLHPDVRHVAIANPVHAPYGRAALSALEQWGRLADVAGKLVFADSVNQAFQWALSRNADAAVIAFSLARSPLGLASGRYFLLPSSAHPPIRQVAAVSRRASSMAQAADFVQFAVEHAPEHATDPGGCADFAQCGFEAAADAS